LNLEIIHLSKEKWKGTELPMGYTTMSYYHVNIYKKENGFGVDIELREFSENKTFNIIDRLYAEYWENPYAWGILVDGVLIGAIEACIEAWTNRLRITELWVADSFRKQGIGKKLLQKAKEYARSERVRSIVLETQSSNVNAIGFYLYEGFSLIGMDTSCYQTNDSSTKETRLEFGLDSDLYN